MRFVFAVAAAFLGCISPVQAEEAAPQLPGLEITLAPGGVDVNGDPAWVDVHSRITGMAWKAGEPFLRIPVKFAGVPGAVYGEDELTVSDSTGPVALEETIDEPDAGGFLYYRRWSPKRDVGSEFTVNYRAPIGLMIPKLGAGPPFDLRAQGGGFSGAGNTFLVLPDTSAPFLIGIRWDLGQLAAGSIGVSSFGQGDTRSPGPVGRLIASYFMAGPLGHYPDEAATAKFSGYWIGSPKFDARQVLQWSEKAYGAIAGFFEDSDPPTFRVLMRGNPYPGGGGAALMSSFLVSYPDSQEDAASLRETIAHETVHNWVYNIAGPPGTTSWFSEGMTVAYTRRLLLRSGLFTPAEFLESVNNTAQSYYTNALNNLPNDQIASRFWSDTRVRSLPYARGSLYFASVDAAVRKQCGGNRSLDDLLKAFIDRRKAGEPVSIDTWKELLAADLGDPGIAALDTMLAGQLVVPASEAFGPCFARVEKTLRRFELGFDRESMFEEPRRVKGLVEGSEAARAGIREGDVILQPMPLERAQAEQDRTLKLLIQRGDEVLEIEYLPRGEPVQGYLWERVGETPDADCAL